MISYSKSGAGDTLVLLHGFCENSTCFNKQVFFLQQSFTVITPDLPGFGASAADEQASMESMADAVHEVLVHEQVNSCTLIGHSMGGYVALAFAKKFPSLLKGLGLMHSTAEPDTDERKQKRDQAIRLIKEKGPESYVRNFIPPLFSSEFQDQSTIDGLIREALRSPAAGLIAALNAMKERKSAIDFLRHTTIPVLFVIGQQDQLIPEKDMFAQAALCRRAEVCYLKHSAHMGYIEEVEKCIEAIALFSN